MIQMNNQIRNIGRVIINGLDITGSIEYIVTEEPYITIHLRKGECWGDNSLTSLIEGEICCLKIDKKEGRLGYHVDTNNAVLKELNISKCVLKFKLIKE